MTTELKTLKDILKSRAFTHRLIQAEAIKWVKHWIGLKEKGFVNENTLAFLEGKISATMQLNNITEEDLCSHTVNEAKDGTA